MVDRGQIEGKRASPAGTGNQTNFAAQKTRELPADSQPQTRAAILSAGQPSACWKASKMICCLSGGDADTRIGNGEGQHFRERG